MDHYMDLLAFTERIARADWGETHAALVVEARRLLASEEQAAVHLANECPECDGAGYYDNGPNVEPEPCGYCHSTGNALRPVPPPTLPPRMTAGDFAERAYRRTG